MRFPEFSGEWIKIKLRDTCSEIQRGSSPRPINDSIWFDKNSNVGWVKISDVSNQNKYLYSTEHYLSVEGIKKSRYLSENNLILSICASIGKPIINKIPVCIHDGFINFKNLHSNINIEFLYYLLLSIKNNWIRYRQPGSQFNLNTNIIKNTLVNIPDLYEQNKIVKFLSLIDKRIETQSKIINQLNLLKNIIINFIFNNINGEYHLIEDIMDVSRGRIISKQELNKQNNPRYPIYSSQTQNDGVMGFLDSYDFDGEYITWTTDGVNAGSVYYRIGKFNCTNVCGVLKNKVDNIDLYFISVLLNKYTKKYVSSNLANPKLMNNVMKKIKIKLPNYNDQIKMSNIFKIIENKINIEKKYLENLVMQKKYLLQNIFI